MSDYLYYCTRCNSLWMEDNNNESVFCSNCGAKTAPLHITEEQWDLLSDSEKRDRLDKCKMPQAQKAVKPVNNTTSSYSQSANNNQNDGNITGMSIAAFICSLAGVPIVGFILGLIDLHYKDGRKRGLSIAAVVISSVLLGLILLFFMIWIFAVRMMFSTPFLY